MATLSNPPKSPYGLARDQYVHYVPTPMRVVRRMLEMAEIQPGETVYDLGSGDGRIVISAVRNYGARGVAIEIDRERIELARRRAGPLLERIAFRRQNVFKVDLRPADVVMIYLTSLLNYHLLRRLERMKRGARVISHNFELPGMAAYKVARLHCRDAFQHNIYAYRIPLTRE